MSNNEYTEIQFRIESPEDLEYNSPDYIEVYEDNPENAKDASEEEIVEMFNNGTLEEGTPILDTKELFIEVDEKSCDLIPVSTSTEVPFSPWFECYVIGKVSGRTLGMASIPRMIVHLKLNGVWRDNKDRLIAKYILEEGEINWG